ncbi:TIR domain-containing protein [Algoriphagus terrigena]|uniref:TIR domain-containing protein n=1 Tax=Algoriphagus terrigena TaxID=344884 RepID=UPI0004287DB8|nr:TIR domain-containing protein [Algoriphagus terrigena]
MIKELQLLAEALWESVKSDLKFFAPIQAFAKKLAELDFTDENEIKDAVVFAEKIEEFFQRYRSTPGIFYIPPPETSKNQTIVKRIFQISQQIKNLSSEEIQSEISKLKPKTKKPSKGGGDIFIGHGRSRLWARVQLFLQDDFKLETLTFESESHTSESIVNILEGFLEKSSFAILMMTAEDETAEGKSRARQNVIHEACLFQGRLGFDKVVILKQSETEDFSNIAGLQYIPFTGDNVEQCFYELQRKLKKSGMIK